MAPKPSVTKKDISYTYWTSGQSGSAPEAPVAAPRKLSDEELAALSQSNTQGSLWNQAGTWEEKSLNDWARLRITEAVQFSEVVSVDGTDYNFKFSLKSCEGDATIVVVRNKRRPGFLFDISVAYSGRQAHGSDGEEVKGCLHIPEAAYGELEDIEVAVVIDSAGRLSREGATALTRALKKLKGRFCSKLQQVETQIAQL